MSRLIYIDTNVYLDYFKGRSSGLIPYNEFAFTLIERAIGCEFRVIVSGQILAELRKYVKDEQITKFFSELKSFDKLIEIKVDPSIKQMAARLSASKKLHYADSLHYAIALMTNAEAIITNDREFQSLSSDSLRIIPANGI